LIASSRPYFTKVLYARLKAQLDGVPVSNDYLPEPLTRSPILQATPISSQLLQRSSQVSKSSGIDIHHSHSYWYTQNSSFIQVPQILQRHQPIVPSTQPSPQASVTVLYASVNSQHDTDCDSFITIVTTYLSNASTLYFCGKCRVMGCVMVTLLQETTQDTTESIVQCSPYLVTIPATGTDDELPSALNVPPPSFEGYVTVEVNITCSDAHRRLSGGLRGHSSTPLPSLKN